jgi:hypothetical protein
MGLVARPEHRLEGTNELDGAPVRVAFVLRAPLDSVGELPEARREHDERRQHAGRLLDVIGEVARDRGELV